MKIYGGLTIVLLAGLALVGCDSSVQSSSTSSTPTPEPVATVDAATVTKVQQACKAHLEAVAKNSGREIAGVPPKPYTVAEVRFDGEVKEVALPYTERAWEVPLTALNTFANGDINEQSDTCRFRELQQDAQLLTE